MKCIRLNCEDLILAANLGVKRRVTSIVKGHRSKHSVKETDSWSLNIEGALAELAAAKALGIPFELRNESFKAADLGDRIQVRLATNHSWGLIVRHDDNPDHAYVLVTGSSGDYRVHGWIPGSDAKKPEHIRCLGNGRPDVYLIDQSKLRPLEELHNGTHTWPVESIT